MTVKIEQAFTSDFIGQGFGLPIAHENDSYKPTAETAYAAIRCFPNEEGPADLAETNNTTGFFQFTLRYPEGAGAMEAKQMRETIFSAYQIGRNISYSGQKLTITARYPFEAYPEDGWFKVVGRINYSAFIENQAIVAPGGPAFDSGFSLGFS